MDKKTFAGIVLASASVFNAHAQAPKAPDVRAANQDKVEKIYNKQGEYLGSVKKNDTESTTVKQSYIHQSAPTSGPAETTAESTTPPQNNKNNIEIGGTDGGIAGAITFANGDIGIRLAADKDKKGEHLLAAMGLGFQNGHAIVGASMGREDIDGFDKKVTAKGVFVQLNMTNLSSEVRRVFVEAMRKISADQQLAYSETGFTNISQQNLGDILRTITTQGKDIHETNYFGGSENRFGVGMELKVSELGRLTITLSHVARNVAGQKSNSTSAGLLHEVYLPNSAKVALSGNTSGVVGVGGEMQIGDSNWTGNVAISKDTKHGNTMVYGGGKYYFDDIKGVFVPPATPASHLQNGLNGLNTNSPVVPRGIAAMGEVKSSTYRVIDSVTVEDNKVVKPEVKPKPEVEEPKPPVNPETPNEAPVANPDTVTVTAGGTVIINPLSNDTDANGDTLSLASFEDPTIGGTVTKSGNSLTFVSDGSTGTITFKYWTYDGKVNSLTPGIITINVNAAADPAPVVGGAFAALADMEISDQAGLGPILPINAGGVIDTLNRTIVYSATGLPSGLSIDSSTGVISGIYDCNNGIGFPGDSFNVIVKAQATGSTKSATKQFTLTIRDDG